MTPQTQHEIEELSRFIDAMFRQIEADVEKSNIPPDTGLANQTEAEKEASRLVTLIAFATGLNLGASSVARIMAGHSAYEAVQNIRDKVSDMRKGSR